MLCMNCEKEFIPCKVDARIKFCSEKCRTEYRLKTGYMKTYYSDSVDKWKKRQHTEEYKQQKNAARRKKYAENEEFRNKHKNKVKEYIEKNPDAKLNQHLRKYGLDKHSYFRIMESQNGKCAICGSEIGDSVGNRLYVDHNHADGSVRGLLCSKCNFGIGQFQDDPTLLRKAAKYLEV